MPPLSIGFDARAFVSPAAGVRRYADSLFKALASLEEDITITVLNDGPFAPRQDHPELRANPLANLAWSAIGLPIAARRRAVDVVHAPAYIAPLWGTPPVVLTIHDVTYERHPEWYPHHRDPVRRAFYRRSARSAARIVTDSEFSAGEIAAAYGIPRERIHVVPLGADPRFSPGSPANGCPLPQEISGPFVLHVGDLHERRNLPTVVDAVLAARRHFGGAAAVSLVLAGVDRGVGDGLCAIASGAGVPEAVVKLGPVSEDLLLSLYRCATALVYPSLYEGFGLPVLEAMACGTPVIASRAASIPEVLGDAGLLLDPHDVRAWTEAVVNVVNDDDRRAQMRSKGLARASEFTWARTARMTLEVYRKAARA